MNFKNMSLSIIKELGSNVICNNCEDVAKDNLDKEFIEMTGFCTNCDY